MFFHGVLIIYIFVQSSVPHSVQGYLSTRHQTMTPSMILKYSLYPQLKKRGNNFDLSHIMNNNKFNHVGLADTGIHWKYLPYDNRTPQIFHRHFMSQQLDYASAYNHHGILSGAYQHGRTTSLTTGKLFGRK